ncbi:MAG: type II toxin-antitoxin system VapC family toxin [Treponema sp.]|jgi:tRNA(fMet)-specific endonuclease VapC|nr:type II toxin-antitoxin system VapC family toxin [Treponema sp.]
MLDTNICIYIIKKKTETVLNELKRKRKKGLYISAITVAELEFGNANANSLYKERNQLALLEFLSIMGIKHFNENAAKEYGIIKKYLKDKNYLIGPFDMLIGAHAKSLNMTLVTNNIREFERIQGLKIENWV